MKFLTRRSVTVEVAVDDSRGLMVAARGGAHRCEISIDRDRGGLTPSYGTLQHVARSVDYMVSSGSAPQPNFGVHALIRPRVGGFAYRDDELSVMASDIEHCRNLGLAGVKFGALTPDYQLDMPALRSLVKVARGSTNEPRALDLTFHGAIDLIPEGDLLRSLDVLQELGFTRVMTSGGDHYATAAIARITRVVKHCRGKLEVQVMGGINAENVADILRLTAATSVQVSASVPSGSHAPLYGDHEMTNAEMVSRVVQAASNL